MFEFLSNLMNSGGVAGPTSFSANENVSAVGGNAGAQPSGNGISGLFADPNFQSFLAGTGAALDPNGVGGAIGKTTQGMIQSKQMGKAMEKQDKKWNALIEALGTGKVGSASLKEDGQGGTTVSLKAPEGLGDLNKPMAQDVKPSPFEDWMSGMSKWKDKYLGGM